MLYVILVTVCKRLFEENGISSVCAKYRTRAIISRSRFEAALVYKPRILGLKIEEFLFLVHNWSVT